MARPTNQEAFAERANADRLLRKEFETLNAALLEWDARSGSFAAVLAAIDAIDDGYRVAADVPTAVGKGEGPTSLLGAATRLRDLSAAHAKLLEIAGRVDALKVAVRDQLAVAAAELAKERRQHMPDYMAQLVNAILAQGVTQQDIGVPSKKLAQYIVSSIRDYRHGKHRVLARNDASTEPPSLEVMAEITPSQPLPSAVESAEWEIPYAHLWRNLPRQFLGARIIEERKEPGREYPSLPPHVAIEEFVGAPVPLSTSGGTLMGYLVRDRFHIETFYPPVPTRTPEENRNIALSWAILFAHPSKTEERISPYLLEMAEPLQSPWNADWVIRFASIT